MECQADKHRRMARRYLKEAQAADDLERRQALVDLCEQELLAAVVARKLIDNAMLRNRRRWPL